MLAMGQQNTATPTHMSPAQCADISAALSIGCRCAVPRGRPNVLKLGRTVEYVPEDTAQNASSEKIDNPKAA
jgi:hypothetical protein